MQEQKQTLSYEKMLELLKVFRTDAELALDKLKAYKDEHPEEFRYQAVNWAAVSISNVSVSFSECGYIGLVITVDEVSPSANLFQALLARMLPMHKRDNYPDAYMFDGIAFDVEVHTEW